MASKKQSAGLLMYCIGRRLDSLRVLIAHPGGPLFTGKDQGYWGIPKGEIDPDEDPLDAARREFEEETGMKPDAGEYIPLGNIIQKGGKVVHAWAFEGDWRRGRVLVSNQFSMEWPPRSGQWIEIPEIDEVMMVSPDEARLRLKPEQCPLVDRLFDHLSGQVKLDPVRPEG